MKRLNMLGASVLAAAFAAVGIHTDALIATPEPAKGEGMERAKHRLAAKRRRNAEIPDTSVYTRQRRRADQRRAWKDHVSAMRRAALKERRRGDTAAVIEEGHP